MLEKDILDFLENLIKKGLNEEIIFDEATIALYNTKKTIITNVIVNISKNNRKVTLETVNKDSKKLINALNETLYDMNKQFLYTYSSNNMYGTDYDYIYLDNIFFDSKDELVLILLLNNSELSLKEINNEQNIQKQLLENNKNTSKEVNSINPLEIDNFIPTLFKKVFPYYRENFNTKD